MQGIYQYHWFTSGTTGLSNGVTNLGDAAKSEKALLRDENTKCSINDVGIKDRSLAFWEVSS